MRKVELIVNERMPRRSFEWQNLGDRLCALWRATKRKRFVGTVAVSCCWTHRRLTLDDEAGLALELISRLDFALDGARVIMGGVRSDDGFPPKLILRMEEV